MSRRWFYRLALLPAILSAALALGSCGAPAGPAQVGTEGTSQLPTPPESAEPPPPPSSPVSGVPTETPGQGSPSPVLSTFSGTWEDVRYSFDHPADWTVQDITPESPEGSGSVSVTGPDGTLKAALTILIAWGAECPCVERPAVHLGDLAGKAPLSKSGRFVVRSMAMDLTGFPQDRNDNGWPDNVRVVTSLTSNTAPAPTALMPRLMYGLGLVDTGVVAPNGITHRTILFTSNQDFGTLAEAQAYAESDEHRKVQEMIASFREGSA
ncbi:hypothetical protein CXX84_03345 [Arthrobacter sp. AFG7.2]|uniref:hypothetical protein n=1 Tax=Arthrobacter sp. AFG7.2 TaxID=1688693 RepID=UPI000C9DF060|nr:hypothetical protein [Arthrobacter sp. AFG7.2]PNI10505.1 hypothetical protein CXX84_03345 [Arthrobacter sp. AFG7.2]